MSADSPTFSVIVCHYNDVGYLSDGLARVFAQSRVPDQVILVDDGSDPDQREIAETIVRAYPDLEMIWQSSNQGVVAAGNAGLERAYGDFVAWWSVDDHIAPDLIANVERAAVAHPTAGVISPETHVAYEDDERLVPAYTHRYGLSADRLFLTGDEFSSLQRRRYIWLGSSGAFIRRDVLVGQGGWREDLGLFADWTANYMAAFRHGVTLIGAPMSTIVRRADSYSARVRATRGAERRALNNLLDTLHEPGNASSRAALRHGALALSYAFGSLFVTTTAARPRDWDLLLAAAVHHGVHLALRLLRRGNPDVATLLKRDLNG